MLEKRSAHIASVKIFMLQSFFHHPDAPESLKRDYCKYHGFLYFNMINITRHTKMFESKDLRERS